MRRQLTTQVGEPAAGADWTFVPSTSDYVRLLAITAVLVTSATSASRAVTLQAKDSNGLLLDAFPAVDAATASTTVTYVWDDASTVSAAASDKLTLTQSVPRFWLPPGTSVGTSTADIDTGDQWSAIVATYATRDHWRWLQEENMLDDILAALGKNG